MPVTHPAFLPSGSTRRTAPALPSARRLVAGPCLAVLVLLAACTSRSKDPPIHDPTPDLAVTTLERRDIDTVATLLQIQGTLALGLANAEAQPQPPAMGTLLAAVRDQQLTRKRDLDALVVLKHAPPPSDLGRRHTRLLEELAQAGAAQPAPLLAFLRSLHEEALAVARDAADGSPDPDVRMLAARQLPAIASTLKLIERTASAGAAP